MSIEKLREFAQLDNIAEELDDDLLAKIGQDAVEGYKLDISSRSAWEESNEEVMKLAMQVVEEKTYPWPGAANVKFPLITEAALQFNARAYPALVPGTDVVKARTIGFDATGQKLDTSIRVSKHMSYQLLEEMEEWEEHMDKLLMAIPIIGCMFKKTYYDPMKRRNVSVCIHPKDFVVDYYTTSLEDAYRKTHVLAYNKNDIQKYINMGMFLDVNLGDPQGRDDEHEQDENHGLTQPSINEATPYKILEQYTYLDLDEDGISEPYIITVDCNTAKVLRIYAGYDPDEILVSDSDPELIVDVPQKQYFVKYGFIPSPDGGFYDIAFGQLLSPISNTVDTVINQLLDAGHLSTLQAGFLGRGLRMKKGDYKLAPGEWVQINSTGDDIRKNIFPLPTREPSSVLFQLLGLMINQAQRLASTVDSMVGENPGQNQKATTTLAVLEQGTKVFSSIYKRLHRSFKQELKLLFDLNAMYLEDEQYFNILDLNLPMEQQAVIRQTDYDKKAVNIVPAADTAVTSQQQKMMKAQAMLELAAQTGMVNMQEAVRRVLEAQEQPGIDILMQVPPRGPSIEEQQLELEKFKAQLEVVKLQQNDLAIKAKAIKDIADAESKESGTDIAKYQAAMEALVKQAELIGVNEDDRETDEGGDTGMEGQ